MKTVQTHVLSGLDLNLAVAIAEGQDVSLWSKDHKKDRRLPHASRYATDWAQAGPIIQRLIEAGFELMAATFSDGFQCLRVKDDSVISRIGPTPIIAAMRCYVALKFGDTVEIPDLTQEQ